MIVLVSVKTAAVVDEEFELTPDGLTIDPDFLDFELNEWDRYAVESAVEIREAGGVDEVVLVTVDGDWATEALRVGLAMGADRAVRIWGDDLPVVPGPLLVANLVGAFADTIEPDLIFCGAQSSDSAWGATGIALAAVAKVPHVAVVRELAFDQAGRTVEATRELDGGVTQRLRVGLPAAFTVQTGANQPRYANLRAIKQAGKKPLEVISPTDLNIEPGSVTEAQLRRLYVPESQHTAEMIEGNGDTVAARVAEIVAAEVGS